MIRIAWLMALILAATACSPGVVRNAPPTEFMTEAVVPGIPNARYWRSRPPKDLLQQIAIMLQQRRAAGIDRSFHMLAMSGGADDGAFGAGLMAAWTARGDRPEFHIVTGVSTGALSAPFVFLGSEWDDELKQVYGGFTPDQIFKVRNLIDILPSVSAADPGPLINIIAKIVDEKFLAEVAREHKRGRRFFVQTTNLDAQEAVIWDMGAIAASGAPNALDLFRKVLMASASVPGAFPPVLIQVELNGKRYDEMHVDGGVISESTVLAEWQPDLQTNIAYKKGSKRTLYVIRNGRIAAEPKEVDYNLLSIGGRAASTMIKSQGVNDLLTAYTVSEQRKTELFLTWIGEDFDAPYPGPFDPGYMKALYNYGYDLMASGRAWESRPPQIMTAAERARALRVKQ